MLRTLFILIIMTGFYFSGLSQSHLQDDSLIYVTIIKSVIPNSAKSILIIDRTIKYEHQTDTAAIVDSNSIDPNEILTRKYEWENSTKTTFDSIAYRPMVRYYIGEHTKREISYRFSFPFRVLFLSEEEYQNGKDSDRYWEVLNKKYPNTEGILSFSEVFYSIDRSRAVLYYSIRRKKGKGSVICFQKVNGKWENKFETIVWHN